MSNPARNRTFFISFLILIGLIFTPKLFLAHAAVYTEFLTEKPLLYVGSVSRLLFLLIGFFLARRAASAFDPDNPVRKAWRLLSWGLLCYFLGQSILALYQLVLSMAAPFPSLGDVFFLTAMVLWLIALVLFVHTYTRAGFLEGGAQRAAAVAIVAVVLLGVVGYWILLPVLETSAPGMEKALNIAYPVSDLILMIPVLILLQMALKLRGGRLWYPWMALLAGFIFLALGDILFAYFTTLGMEFLDPLLDVMFTYSYIFIAWGAALQNEIV